MGSTSRRRSSVQRSRSRTVVIAAAAMLAMQSTLLPAVASAQAPDAKQSLASGDKAARAKDWAKAQADYQAANAATPSADALDGLANAHYQQKHDVDAYVAYESWIKTYGPSSPAKKRAAEARLQELAGKTGLLGLDTTESGAAISVDDKPSGTTPLAAPLRLAVGPHRVRITKDGFVPFDQVPNVAPGTTTTLAVKLEAQTTKGRLSVREKSGKAIRIFVDGVDMGESPWVGEVEAGPHEVSGRSGPMTAAPEKLTVERGKTREVELVASASYAPLKVGTSDGKGLIYLDDKLVGEGSFASDVPSGSHVLRITREGYDPFEETIELKEKEPLARTIVLKLSSKIDTGPVQKENRPLEGVYGGFGLLMTLLPGGTNSSMQKLCEGPRPPELTGCSGETGGIGGGLTGFLGYHWDPVGVELFLGAQYDQATPSQKWVGASTDPGFGSDPPRTEDFTVRRVGGLGALRVRLTLQGEKLRFSVAGGVGLSYRSVLLTRTATRDSDGATDKLVPDAQGYLSPVLSLEPSLQYRLGAHTAIALGFSVLAESPRAFDQIPTTPGEKLHGFSNGPGAPASAINTPAYELATGTQVFIGPFIGMMFGP